MARRAVQVARRLPGLASLALVLALTLGTLMAVALRADGFGALGPADWAALRFTISQAIVSAVLSVALAVPAARALARQRFRGRALLITLLGAPFLLPVIVAILGLLAVFGRNGVCNVALEALGLPTISIYGFQGVVLAHVFFNLPLATRLILQGWLSIPAERFRLAASLDVPVFRLLEWPMLRQAVPGALLVIFLICLTSFAVALTLGGGPGATTIELAIYQAIRFDFDLGRAALLSILQFGLCGVAACGAYWLAGSRDSGVGLDRVVQRWDRSGFQDIVWLGLVATFLLLPLLMVVLRGLPGLFEMPQSVYWAAGRSVLVATGSALLCAGMSLAISMRGGITSNIIAVLPLAASSLVIGTGAFLILRPYIAPRDAALVVTLLVNATMALPFAIRALAPAVAAAEQDYGRLADTLGLSGFARLRLVILPRVRGPLGFATGLAAALSMGDLGVIALFAGQETTTLPLEMFRLMGAYRMDAAAGAALLLLALSLVAFWVCDKGGRADAAS